MIVDKTSTTQTEQIAGTVRREVVDVDEDYERHRAAYEQEYAKRAGATGTPFAEAEPHFRTGYGAARDPRYAGKAFEEVEPELRRTAGAPDDAWERIKREVRAGFDRARGR